MAKIVQANATEAVDIPANHNSRVSIQIDITLNRPAVSTLVKSAGLSLLRRVGMSARSRQI